MIMSHYFFLIDSFLRLGQKYKNIFVVFLVQMESFISAFEINWPLEEIETRSLSNSGSSNKIVYSDPPTSWTTCKPQLVHVAFERPLDEFKNHVFETFESRHT